MSYIPYKCVELYKLNPGDAFCLSSWQDNQQSRVKYTLVEHTKVTVKAVNKEEPSEIIEVELPAVKATYEVEVKRKNRVAKRTELVVEKRTKTIKCADLNGKYLYVMRMIELPDGWGA